MNPLIIRPAAEQDFNAVTALLDELGRPRVTPEQSETPDAYCLGWYTTSS